jgi:magnesium chelatase subunit D
LEAEIRRNIRRVPKGAGKFHKIGENNLKVAKIEFTNRNKVTALNDNTWSGDIAIPETLVSAKTSNLMDHNDKLTLKKEHFRVYTKRSYVSSDVCLLIDASASMAGEKRQAACYLAQYLLLTGRDRVAVVTFQETRAQVVVPFTRNQKVLSRGLTAIRPGGLTPLADGILRSVELMNSERLRNPVLILITDGVPNFPVWSFDAKKDAIEAARKIAESKIGFICIDVVANRDYMTEIAKAGNGKLYVVDDLNRTNLLEIVRLEKRVPVIH